MSYHNHLGLPLEDMDIWITGHDGTDRQLGTCSYDDCCEPPEEMEECEFCHNLFCYYHKCDHDCPCVVVEAVEIA